MNDWTLGPAHDGGCAGATVVSFGGPTIWCGWDVVGGALGPAEGPDPMLTTWKEL